MFAFVLAPILDVTWLFQLMQVDAQKKHNMQRLESFDIEKL